MFDRSELEEEQPTINVFGYISGLKIFIDTFPWSILSIQKVKVLSQCSAHLSVESGRIGFQEKCLEQFSQRKVHLYEQAIALD